ncbi:hypothetical protein ACFFKC_09960 [Pseudoduganella danionis]|uniref:Uncharacterized protein n=1 Tax=Pseudoduganella danionis TaxID=1890295 RepID=A0ABW9SKF4_9BURK|nr:hypothetical protein [Pseudoduganella danionis]MTW32651.1 hypothetical protein [Pseudoduganella danionis]
MTQLVITNETQAFDALQLAIEKQFDGQVIDLKFDGWPVLEIKLEGEGYDSTITSDMANAIVEVQRAVNRTYARVVKHSAHARSLTDGERQELQFKAKVKTGSSIIEVNLGDFAEKLATSISTSMTPEMMLTTVLGTAALGAGLLAYKSFLKHRSDDKQIEQTERSKLAMRQEETRRLQIMADALSRVPQLQHVQEDFDIARNAIVGATGDADSLTVNSLQLDAATTRVIATARRTESQEVQLNGSYSIIATDLSKPDLIKLRVQASSDGREFQASFQDNSLDQSQIKILQDAEWTRSLVYLSINARILRGEVSVATVVSVQAQPVSAARGEPTS